jgi:protease-4
MRSLFRTAATIAAGLLVAQALADPPSPVKVGYVELDGPIAARHATLGLGGVPTDISLIDVLTAIDRAGKDPEMKGLVIRLKDVPLTSTTVEEIGSAVDRFRKSGRKVHLYAEGYETSELLLGSHCDEVILQQGGEVSVPGVYMEEMFLADAFKWVGVTPDYVQVGDYKGASEMYANAKPSPQWDSNINALLDAMYAEVRAQLKKGRHLDDRQLDDALENAWMATGSAAKNAKLIDTEMDLPELGDHLEKLYGGEVEWDDSLLPDPAAESKEKLGGSPFALLGSLFKQEEYKPRRATIAVLHVDGAIADGESGGGGGLMGGEAEVGARTIKHTIEDLIDDDRIKGVVLRIDSPGGSAIASEMIWQSVKRLRKTKPVYVSVGSMAASGGYYIAVSGERIYVDPSSIVGSIGVVGGKMALGGAYEKLHINVVSRARGPHAAVFGGSTTPWSESERALVRKKMTETYELFASRVTAGRSGIDLKKTAEGRLFVGQQAIDLKMADRLGGLESARDDMAASLNMEPGSYDVMDYPAPQSFMEAIGGMLQGFGVGAHAPKTQSPGPLATEVRRIVRSVVGPANEARLASAMSAMWQMRKEPVILAAPRVLIFK